MDKMPKLPKMVFCKILEREIPFTRCTPIKELRHCESCEGYPLKVSARMLRKLRKKEKGGK